jgi:hypothetical protein
MLTKVYYYGSGEEAVSLSEEQGGLSSEECTDCKGTGYTGGKLRNETPPILANFGVTPVNSTDKPKPPMNSSEAIEHYEENKEFYDTAPESKKESGMVI